MSRRIRHIGIVFAVLLTALPLQAKKPQPAPLTTEQQQQFTYYWYAARQALDKVRYADAYALLEFCHAIKPDDPQTLYYLGVIQSALEQEDEAKQYFEQAYHLQKGPHSEDLLMRLGNIYINQRDWKKALKIRDELDQLNGYDAYSAITRYRIYVSAGQPKEALQAIDAYLKTDPSNLRFMLFRIDVLEHIGAKPKVLYEAYDRVLELDPFNLMVLNNYAYLLSTHKGDLKRAERMSEITIREQPSNAVYLDTYGWILHLQGQNDLAKFYLERALWNAADEKTKAEVTRHLEKVKAEK